MITNPEEARELLASQRTLRATMLASLAFDVVIAVVLLVMGIPVAIVAAIAVVMIGTGLFFLRRTMKANQARLANFRDPVTGDIQIP